MAASTRDFATRERYESNKARWLMGRDADALEPYMDWDLPAPPNIATVISVGGEDGKPSSLPDWFPQVNLEGLSESIKAQ